MVIMTAFVLFNGVAIKPLVHLLQITNKTGQLKREKRENEFYSIVEKLIYFHLSLCVTKGKELFGNHFKSSEYGQHVI